MISRSGRTVLVLEEAGIESGNEKEDDDEDDGWGAQWADMLREREQNTASPPIAADAAQAERHVGEESR